MGRTYLPKRILCLLIIVLLTLPALSTSTAKFSFKSLFEKGNWYYKPKSYSELVRWYRELEERFPNYVEVIKANELYGTGRVKGGYDLYYVRITNESLGLHKPEVLFLGSPHGDETAGTIGLYWFADWLLRKTLTDEDCEYEKSWLKWLIDHREIYIEVSHNPWGFDHCIRYDRNGWDLNREADHDGPGRPTGGIWGSVNGKTLRAFIDSHAIRVGCDFHGGARMLLYPWSSSHDSVSASSPLTGKSYTHVPPDFYYFDAISLRLGDFMGDFGGDLDYTNMGTIPDTVGYEAPGCIACWAYGANVKENPAEDRYVHDEEFGNYPGCGVLWISPELSRVKNPPEKDLGNDTVDGYGKEVQRFLLHQIDLAQPYIMWVDGTPKNNSRYPVGTVLKFRWKVNGCMVVDHTNIQWGTDPDPIRKPKYFTIDHDEHENQYIGGTGWDFAKDGKINGTVYEETIQLNEPGSYYFVAKAMVDQIYRNVVHPEIYGNRSYLRIIKERTDPNYYEVINGTDGKEVIKGRLWWYSPVIHVIIGEDNIPPTTEILINGTRGEDGWYTSEVQISFKASDNLAGVNYTLYSIDGSEWKVYRDKITLGEGVHEIRFFSADFLGNVEEENVKIVKVDPTPPKSTCKLSGDEGEERWFRGDVAVHLDAEDSTSGVKAIYYNVDNSTWRIYTTEFTVKGEGLHHLCFYSVDEAGNREKESCIDFAIDVTKPNVTLLYPRGGEVLTGFADIRWLASDNLGDLKISLFCSNNNGSTWYTIASDEENDGRYVWNTREVTDGKYIIKITASDNARNTASDVSGSLIISNGINPPKIEVDFVKPRSGKLYFLNREIMDLPDELTIVVGQIDIKVNVTMENSLSKISRVEFYVDNELRAIDKSPPFEWRWKDRACLKKYSIMVVAYDNIGNNDRAKIELWKIL